MSRRACWAWLWMAAMALLMLSRLTSTRFLMLRALAAYLRVLSVSSMLESATLTHAIMHVLLLPPSESCSILVSLDCLRHTTTGPFASGDRCPVPDLLDIENCKGRALVPAASRHK